MKARGVDWLTPILLAVLTASGLLSALISDGIGDLWAWIALGAPLVTAAYCIWCRPVLEKKLRGKQEASTR
jgi:hypothetical protein